MVKKKIKKWRAKAGKANRYADLATLKMAKILAKFNKIRKGKIASMIVGKQQKGKGRKYRRQRGGAAGLALALGLGLPMMLQATQGILNSRAVAGG